MKAVWVKMAQDAGFSPASVWLSAKSNGEKPKKKEFTAKYKCTYQGKEYTWTGVGLQPKKELRLAMGLATLDDWAKLSATEKKEKLRPYLIQ
jgi:DNA-binding protein H-NS